MIFCVCVCIKALALTSEAYFSALAKMGEQALNTLSSRSLGKTQVCVMCVLLHLQTNASWADCAARCPLSFYLYFLAVSELVCTSYNRCFCKRCPVADASSVIKHKIWLSKTLGSLPM